jgi:hypothetical protein
MAEGAAAFFGDAAVVFCVPPNFILRAPEYF